MRLVEKYSIKEIFAEELIEEHFLKDADAEFILNWLKDNALDVEDSADKFETLDFPQLRSVYEPQWAESPDDRLLLAVCLYGRDRKTLVRLYHEAPDDLYRLALSRNPSFTWFIVHPVTMVQTLSHKDLEELVGENASVYSNKLFYSIFASPALSPNFITSIFQSEAFGGHNPVKDRPRLLYDVFDIIMHNAEHHFGNAHLDKRDGVEDLVCELTSYIKHNFPFYEKPHFLEFGFALDLVQAFLKATEHLGKTGIIAEEKLAAFDVDDLYFGHNREKSFYIQHEFARRACESYSTITHGELYELRDSKHPRLRSIYFQHASLAEIYGDHSFERSIASLEHKLSVYFKLGENNNFWLDEQFTLTDFQRNILEKIKTYLNSHPYEVVAGLIKNSSHYVNEVRRSILSELLTLIWPIDGADSALCLGEPSLVALFDRRCIEIKKRKTRFF